MNFFSRRHFYDPVSSAVTMRIFLKNQTKAREKEINLKVSLAQTGTVPKLAKPEYICTCAKNFTGRQQCALKQTKHELNMKFDTQSKCKVRRISFEK